MESALLFNSDLASDALHTVSENLDGAANLIELNDAYDCLVHFLHSEMDMYMDYKDVKSTKPIHAHRKPWWSSHLKLLWTDDRSNEQNYSHAYAL